MEQYIIKGGNPLVGEVEIGGAKNAALGILAAAIMADEPVLIENLPDVNDINVMLEAIEGIGAMVQRFSFVFRSGSSSTYSSSSLSIAPSSRPGFIPSSINSLPLTASCRRVTH